MCRVLGIGGLGILALLVGSRDAGATSITFTASAGASCALTGGTNTSSTLASVVATQGTCASNGISGQAQAIATGAGLGAFAETSYICCPSSSGGSAFAQLDTQVFFTGPAALAGLGNVRRLLGRNAEGCGLFWRANDTLAAAPPEMDDATKDRAQILRVFLPPALRACPR